MSRPQSVAGPPLPPGRAFGPFVLVRKLAESGMAEVFLAKRVGPGGFERNVVIKRMLRHLSALPDFVDMFHDEAMLAARLAHPNIIHIEEPGFVDGYHFICMEYLAGEDFCTVLRRGAQGGGQVPLPVVLRVLVEAAHGLHHAHEQSDEQGRPLGVVHRDVSPSNLFLTYQGQVKVLDFGIAKAGSRNTQTDTGVVKGKYSYMAPEQARGGAVDRRADVYSLGVSLYEALTGVRPFARDHALAVLNAVLVGDVVPPRQLRPEVPEALEAIVLRAMASEPSQRFATAAALAEALEAFAHAHAPLASSAQLAAYLRGTFGEERVVRRSRIPTLATVLSGEADGEDIALELPGGHGTGHRGATAVLPAEATQAAAVTPVRAPTPVPAERTRVLPPAAAERTGVLAPTQAEGRLGVMTDAVPAQAAGSRAQEAGTPRRWRALVVGALAGGLLVAVAALMVGRALLTSPGAPQEVAVRPAAAPPAPVAAPVQEPSPVATQAAPAGAAPAPGGAAGASPASAAAASPAAPVPSAGAAPAPSTRVRRRLPVVLDAADIQRVVSRGQAGIMACFEKHKADLPADEGEVRVRFDIAGSGQVQAHTLGPLAQSAVGRCLEVQVQRLRFPAHRDEQVSAVQPFRYRVTR